MNGKKERREGGRWTGDKWMLDDGWMEGGMGGWMDGWVVG